MLPPEVSQYFIPLRGSAAGGAALIYHPLLLGSAEIRYSDSKAIDMSQQLTVLATITDGPVPVDWAQGSVADVSLEDLEKSPEPVPDRRSASTASKRRATLPGADLSSWIYRNQKLDYSSPTLDLASNPGEAGATHIHDATTRTRATR